MVALYAALSRNELAAAQVMFLPPGVDMPDVFTCFAHSAIGSQHEWRRFIVWGLRSWEDLFFAVLNGVSPRFPVP